MKKATRKSASIAPCVVTKFDANGDVVAVETQLVSEAKRLSEWEPDIVRNHLRVMAEQETGEEIFVAYANNKSADRIIAEHMKAHPEHRNCWTERI